MTCNRCLFFFMFSSVSQQTLGLLLSWKSKGNPPNATPPPQENKALLTDYSPPSLIFMTASWLQCLAILKVRCLQDEFYAFSGSFFWLTGDDARKYSTHTSYCSKSWWSLESETSRHSQIWKVRSSMFHCSCHWLMEEILRMDWVIYISIGQNFFHHGPGITFFEPSFLV